MIKFEENKIYAVMYHFILHEKNLISKNLKGIKYKNFIEQINFFKSRCNILSQDDFLNILYTNKIPKKPSIILTFDDGYIEHYNIAFPYLYKKKISGIFYPVANSIKRKLVLDINLIHYILSKEENTRKIINLIKKKYNQITKKNFDNLNLSKINLNSRYDTKDITLVKRLLQYFLSDQIRKKILNYVYSEIVDIPKNVLAKKIYASASHLIEMKKNNMSFGIHGINHEWWGKISLKRQKKEIFSSMKYLKSIKIVNDNFSACYPHSSFNESTIKLLSEKKVKFAFTTYPDSISKLNIKKKLILPRYNTNDFIV